jgi:8-oxo-dGTP pyrophosphatase MutT (NUDIX family)
MTARSGVRMPREAVSQASSPPASVAGVSDRVEAAGGVVVRGGQVLLVHRPRYDDWTLPKGKLDEGESFEDAALREVEEETGLRCHLVRELPSTEYHVGGRPKIVRYWLMEPDADIPFVPNDETDALRWLVPDEALRLLTYDRDRDVLAAAG